MHYTLGYHPLFQFLRCMLRIKDKPYFVGSLLTLCGYCWAFMQDYPTAVSDGFMRYLRSEQISRLQLHSRTGQKA